MRRYERRLSGPLLDRLDLYVRVDRVGASDLAGIPGESSALVSERVATARKLAHARSGGLNARLAVADLDRTCRPSEPARRLLAAAVDRLGLSARGYHRCLRVARTVADLESAARVTDRHVREALGFRHLASDPTNEPDAA